MVKVGNRVNRLGSSKRFSIAFFAMCMGACAYAEPEETSLTIFDPIEVTLTQNAVERSELRVVPTCGRIYADGIDEIGDAPRPIQLVGLLTEFCLDPQGFQLNKTYIVEYLTSTEGENRIQNAVEIILWNNEGINVPAEEWLLQAIPVEFESMPCSSIEIGPFGMTGDFGDKPCIHFKYEHFVSALKARDAGK